MYVGTEVQRRDDQGHVERDVHSLVRVGPEGKPHDQQEDGHGQRKSQDDTCGHGTRLEMRSRDQVRLAEYEWLAVSEPYFFLVKVMLITAVEYCLVGLVRLGAACR